MKYYIDHDNCVLRTNENGHGLFIWSSAAQLWRPYFPANNWMLSSREISESHANAIISNTNYVGGPVAEVEVVGTDPTAHED